MKIKDVEDINTNARLAITILLKLTKSYRKKAVSASLNLKATSAFTTVFIKSMHLLNSFKRLGEQFPKLEINNDNVDQLQIVADNTEITLMRLQALLMAASYELRELPSDTYELRTYRQQVVGNAIILLEIYSNKCKHVLAPRITEILQKRSAATRKQLLNPAPASSKTKKKHRVSNTLKRSSPPLPSHATPTEQIIMEDSLPIKSTSLYIELEETNRKLKDKSALKRCVEDYNAIKLSAVEQNETIAIVMCLSGIADAYLLQFLGSPHVEKLQSGQDILEKSIMALEEAITVVNTIHVTQKIQAEELAYGLSIALDNLQHEILCLTKEAEKKAHEYNVVKAQGLHEGWWKKGTARTAQESDKARIAKFILSSCLPKLKALAKAARQLTGRVQLLPITQLSSSLYNFIPHEQSLDLSYVHYTPNVDLKAVNKLRRCLESNLSSSRPHYYFCGGVVADYFLTLSNLPSNINLLITTETPRFKAEIISQQIESLPGFSGTINRHSFGVRDIMLFELDGSLFKIILQRGALDYASYCQQIAWAPQCLLGTIPTLPGEKTTAVFPTALREGFVNKKLQLVTDNLGSVLKPALIQRHFDTNPSLYARMHQLLFKLNFEPDEQIARYLKFQVK